MRKLRPNLIDDPALAASVTLFRYAAACVTAADVEEYAPSDPGYREYVDTFTRIIATHQLPQGPHFAVSETVGLTQWGEAKSEPQPTRFRRFRVFTNSVALVFQTHCPDDDALHPSNYLAINLIHDADELGDTQLLSLLIRALQALHAACIKMKSSDAPLVLLGAMLAQLMSGITVPETEATAWRLLDAGSRCTGPDDQHFLWGCTVYNQLHKRWQRYVKEFLPESGPNLKLLRQALLES